LVNEYSLRGGVCHPELSLSGGNFMKQKNRKCLISLAFLSPIIIMVSIFFVYPLIKVIIMSFQEWQVMGGSKFIGFSNYVNALTDGEFWKTLWNTVIYAIIVTPMIFIPAVLLANFLEQSFSFHMPSLL
jgi:multiple sugar transport system permease protein